MTQRSGIQASCPGASGEAWAPSSHAGKVQGLSASPWFWRETRRPSLCAWGRPPHTLLVEAGAGFFQNPRQLGSPQREREREPRVPRLSSLCSLTPRLGPRRRPSARAGRGANFHLRFCCSWVRGGRGGLAGKIFLPHPHSRPLSCAMASGPLASQKQRPHLNSKAILRYRANARGGGPGTGPGEM